MKLFGVKLYSSRTSSDFYIITAESYDDACDVVCSWSLKSLNFEILEGPDLIDMIDEQYDGVATLSTF